jgi:hypothetical protein
LHLLVVFLLLESLLDEPSADELSEDESDDPDDALAPALSFSTNFAVFQAAKALTTVACVDESSAFDGMVLAWMRAMIRVAWALASFHVSIIGSVPPSCE